MNNELVAWIDPKELDMDVFTSVTKNKQFESDIPLYVQPQKYCPSENNEAYEKGFIDGMAKQRDSAVQRFVEGGTPDSELRNDSGFYMSDAEHYKLKCESQQAEIEKLGSELDRIVELYTDKAIENEALKLRYLTDEKIWKLWQTHLNDDITVFARAILKKAREHE